MALLRPYAKYTSTPTAIQTAIICQAYLFKNAICARHDTIPKTGIKGVKGVLKGLGNSGFDFLSTSIAKQTIAKASRVPNETSLLSTPIGKSPASNMANKPVIMVDI